MDTPPNITAKFRTGIDIKPEKSQVVLVALTVLSAICLLAGFLFLWVKHPYSWIPLVIGLILLIGIIRAWYNSRSDVDMSDANPTTIKDERSGTELTTDPRVFSSIEKVQNIGILLTSLSNREPLPEASGLVNDDGSPNPEKKAEAQEQIRQANEAASELTKKSISFLAGKQHDEGIEPPMIETFGDEILSKTNVEMRND